MAKKKDEGGAPAYMGLFTSLMTILLAFFILLVALAPEQKAGFYPGKGLVANSLGSSGGYGNMKFAKMLGAHGLVSVESNKEGDIEGLLKEEDQRGTGGQGSFDHALPRELQEANYLVVAVPYEFPAGNSKMPKEMVVYFKAMAAGLSGKKITLCSVCVESGVDDVDRELALRRSARIMTFLNRSAFLDYENMNAVGYGSGEFFVNKEVENILKKQKQYLCFYFYE